MTARQATTANAGVSIDVVARDDVSEPNQFRLSNDGVSFKTFSYTSSGSTPTTVAWNLTDPLYGGNTSFGTKTVYAQVKCQVSLRSTLPSLFVSPET